MEDYKPPEHYDSAWNNPYGNSDSRKDQWDKDIRFRDGMREFNEQTSRDLAGGTSKGGGGGLFALAGLYLKWAWKPRGWLMDIITLTPLGAIIKRKIFGVVPKQ